MADIIEYYYKYSSLQPATENEPLIFTIHRKFFNHRIISEIGFLSLFDTNGVDMWETYFENSTVFIGVQFTFYDFMIKQYCDCEKCFVFDTVTSKIIGFLE